MLKRRDYSSLRDFNKTVRKLQRAERKADEESYRAWIAEGAEQAEHRARRIPYWLWTSDGWA
jgi:hypothetical protein